MKRKFKFLLTFMLIFTFVFGSATTISAKSYFHSVNTFDVYLSSNRSQCTYNHKGVKMVSTSYSGYTGYMTFSNDNYAPGYGITNCVDYTISSMKEGGTITFKVGSTVVGKGKIHTYNGGKTYLSIIKIDSIGQGVYYKY